MANCGIYIIQSPSGKAYVGSSRRLRFRRTRHFHELRTGVHHCEALQRAWDKYGDKLTFVVIERCDEVVRDDREQFWIDNWPLFATGLYNSKLTVDRTAPLSEETKRKVSIALKGRVFSESHLSNMRKPKTAEHAAAISAGKKGRKVKPWTDETRAARIPKMAEAWKKRDRASAVAGVKAAWQPGGYLYEARVRPKIDSHFAMLNWIVGSEPLIRCDMFSGLPRG